MFQNFLDTNYFCQLQFLLLLLQKNAAVSENLTNRGIIFDHDRILKLKLEEISLILNGNELQILGLVILVNFKPLFEVLAIGINKLLVCLIV